MKKEADGEAAGAGGSSSISPGAVQVISSPVPRVSCESAPGTRPPHADARPCALLAGGYLWRGDESSAGSLRGVIYVKEGVPQRF